MVLIFENKINTINYSIQRKIKKIDAMIDIKKFSCKVFIKIRSNKIKLLQHDFDISARRYEIDAYVSIHAYVKCSMMMTLRTFFLFLF